MKNPRKPILRQKRGVDHLNVERRIYDLGLPHRAVTVYCYLCDRSNKKGECFPSAKTMAQDLSLSRRTVFRALHELLEKGLIEKQPRLRNNGGSSSNLYRLTDVPKEVDENV